MKKITLILLLALSWQAYSQIPERNIVAKHEMKIDMAYLLSPAFKLEYENLLNEGNSWGIVGFANIANNPTFAYQLLGFYRLYFGKSFASGFFLEGNFGVTGGHRYGSWSQSDDYAAAGAGIALGWKLVTEKGVVLDLFAGLGRLFENNFDPGVYPRMGICLGKRF